MGRTRLRSIVVLAATIVGLSVAVPPDAAAVVCPGPKGAPPNGCGTPTDAQCADATGPFVAKKNAACAAVWADHCACVNQAAFDDARAKATASGATTSRSPSPTKTVFGADGAKNGVHTPNYGIRTDWLAGAPPPAKAARVNTTVRGVKVTNPTEPPMAPMQVHNVTFPGKSKSFGKPVLKLSPKALPKSKQNTWAAQEVLARAQLAGACTGKSGDDLINCARAKIRNLHATPPKLGEQPCEDFVYNRYYDIERWMDHISACGHDALCKASITLDGADSIAGKLLTGSDVEPSKRDALRKFLEAFIGAPTGVNCGNTKLTMDQTRLCEMAHSLPPLAHLVPNYWHSIAGGGSPQMYMTASGAKGLTLFDQLPVGYWSSKNPFYDVAPMFTNIVVNAFAGDPAKLQSVQRLVAELGKGSQYYYVGKYTNGGRPPAGGQKENYPDEWAFQHALHNANKNTSMQTFRDYVKRKTFLTDRADTFSSMLAGAISATIHFAIPASTADANLGATILGATGGLTPALTHPATFQPTLDGATPSRALSARASSMNISAITQKPPSQIDTFAWNGGKNPPKLDPSFPYARLQCNTPLDKVMNGFSSRPVTVTGMPNHIAKTPINGPAYGVAPSSQSYTDVGLAACNYINAVLDEWARFDQAKALAPTDTTPPPAPSGCFANDPACNWDPVSFVTGIEDMVHYQIQNVQAARREADYRFCKEWSPIIDNPPAGLGMKKSNFSDSRSGEMAMLGEMKTAVQTIYNKISNVPVLDPGGPGQKAWGKQLPAAQVRKGDSFATWGEDRHNSETWGNDLFGVGYSFDMGWEVPLRWEQLDNPPGSWALCDFGVGAHGGFEAYAFAFGSDKFDIIDADLVAGANDYVNPSVPGAPADIDNKLHEGVFDAHLTIAGDSLIAEDLSQKANASSTIPLATGANSWTLFTIPFQITFVTLEMSVGVGYGYEIDANVSHSVTNTCHEKDDGWNKDTGYVHKKPGTPSINLAAGINPQGQLNGIVDAYASIAGLAGIGVEVDLTLLGLGLPVKSSLGLGPEKLNFDTELNMDFHTLDGTLSVYAEALFFRLFDIEILSWDGLHNQVPLFNTNTGAQLSAVGVLGGTGLMNPAKSMSDL
jgi:hypothetical protein